jgi:hypothetical protein
VLLCGATVGGLASVGAADCVGELWLGAALWCTWRCSAGGDASVIPRIVAVLGERTIGVGIGAVAALPVLALRTAKLARKAITTITAASARRLVELCVIRR